MGLIGNELPAGPAGRCVSDALDGTTIPLEIYAGDEKARNFGSAFKKRPEHEDRAGFKRWPLEQRHLVDRRKDRSGTRLLDSVLEQVGD